ERYFDLIDRLLKCPSGTEPEVLDSSPELLDAGLVEALVQATAFFAHQNNPRAAEFLAFTAKELARQLGLYPHVEES
ncbi:MAG: hypothetical protein AAFY15_09190, partial [Cyanobacteria bacterium J06648_11]